jgi:hypothetical protein
MMLLGGTMAKARITQAEQAVLMWPMLALAARQRLTLSYEEGLHGNRKVRAKSSSLSNTRLLQASQVSNFKFHRRGQEKPVARTGISRKNECIRPKR